MLIPASDQSKRNFCIALLNEELHANSICPGNHTVDYNHGWFSIDSGRSFRRPDLTEEADYLLKYGVVVFFSSVWNTYVLGE
jgi:hypothetical protein